jgi:hypothetical protein
MKKIRTEVSAHKEQYGDIVATVHDKYGNLKQRIEQPVDSYNQQMWFLLHRNLCGFNSASLAKTPTSNTAFDQGMTFKDSDAPFVNSYTSIIVGSGTTPTAINTLRLETLINLGEGVGELTGLLSTAEFNQSTGISTITRSFVSSNPNSSAISVNEVGLTMVQSNYPSDAAMYVRDVLQSTLTVGYEEILSVQYRIRVASGNNNYTNIVIRTFGLNSGSTSGLMIGTNGANAFALAGALSLIAPEGNNSYGMTFGTSNAAFDKTQFNLQAPIGHGSNANQLFYHAVTNSTFNVNTNANSLSFTFYRSVENRSGSNISVAEVGLVCLGQTTSRFMIDRRVVDPPVTISNGNIVGFQWEFCYEV